MYNYKIQSFYLIARFHNCDLDVLITDAFHLFPFINLERKAIARVQALVEAVKHEPHSLFSFRVKIKCSGKNASFVNGNLSSTYSISVRDCPDIPSLP